MEHFYRRPKEKMEAKRKAMALPVMSFVSGLFVGGLTGAGIMLLFAPRAGRHTRARMQHQVDELREQVIEGIEDAEEDVLTQAHRVTSDVRARAMEMRHQGQKILARK